MGGGFLGNLGTSHYLTGAPKVPAVTEGPGGRGGLDPN